MKRIRKRWFWLAAPAVFGGLALLAYCWTHRVWSVNECRVYQAMDKVCHPVWRDFHFGRIRAGDPVEEVIARTEPTRVECVGPWVLLKYRTYPGPGISFTGLTAAAYDGHMVGAYAWGDTFLRQFFDVMSEEQRAEFFAKYYDQFAGVGNPIIVK